MYCLSTAVDLRGWEVELQYIYSFCIIAIFLMLIHLQLSSAHALAIIFICFFSMAPILVTYKYCLIYHVNVFGAEIWPSGFCSVMDT